MSNTDLKPVRLDLRPGVNRQSTRYAEEGGWFDADKVRFRDGRPENMRGWDKKVDETFLGTSRAMIAWNDLDSNKLIAWGTEQRLYLYLGGQIYDITPFEATTTVNNAVNTSANAVRVVVSSTGHGHATGNYVYFTSAATTVGGNVYLNGEYVVSVIGANSFAVDYASSAVATSAGAGGLLTINWLLTPGTSINVPGLGWGVGPWGGGTWGTPRSTSDVVLAMRQWSLDTWGEDLVANLSHGPTYIWSASAGPTFRAALVTAIPSITSFVMVSPEDRHMIAMGTTDPFSGLFDPLLIRWSDTEDYTQWTAAVTNTAGAIRIGGGANQVIGAVHGARTTIIFTDDSAHEMRFTGVPDTFGFRLLGINAGSIGPHAAADSNGVVYWMSTHNFHKYDGEIQVIPCTLLRHVFEDINLNQKEKVYCGTNKEFNELIWLYPSKDSNEVNRYVVYNIFDGTWVNGNLDWTAWFDQGVFDNVVVCGADHYLRDYEIDDVFTADGAGYESFIESSDFDIGDGDELMFIDKVIPDFDLGSSSSIQLFVTTTKYPNAATVVTKGPFTINDSTPFINMRSRGRQMRLRLSTSAVGAGSQWRLGAMRIFLGPDGKQ